MRCLNANWRVLFKAMASRELELSKSRILFSSARERRRNIEKTIKKLLLEAGTLIALPAGILFSLNQFAPAFLIIIVAGTIVVGADGRAAWKSYREKCQLLGEAESLILRWAARKSGQTYTGEVGA